MRAGGGCQGNHVENKQFTNKNDNVKSVAAKSLSKSVKLIRCKQENENLLRWSHYFTFRNKSTRKPKAKASYEIVS